MTPEFNKGDILITEAGSILKVLDVKHDGEYIYTIKWINNKMIPQHNGVIHEIPLNSSRLMTDQDKINLL